MTTFSTKLAKLKKTTYIASVSILFTGMMSCGDPTTNYTTEEVLDPTQGVVTEVKEMREDLFRITDEQVVPTKADSRIIAEYMDGMRDTFTLEEAQLVDADHPKRSRMSGILMGGMMGYMMGKSMSSPVNRSSYANDNAYKKSTTSNQTLKSTASRKTVKTPRKGFGSTKSTRSYGG